MFYEYAVEPRAIASSWQTFRYVIEKFGFDQGRLISQFPKAWIRLAYDGIGDVLPIERKRIEEALNLAKRNKVVRTGRAYDPNSGDWLHNALTQHALSPFHAIIALEKPAGNESVLPVDQLTEQEPRMAVPRDWEVSREAPPLAGAMRMMLQAANIVMFVDPYYDPFNTRYQSVLRECLRIVQAANGGVICQIHHLDGERCPSVESIERGAKEKFGTVIPEGMTITLYRWREKVRGADFHARYLLTDRGGIRVDAGFSAEGGHQTTDMSLMDFDLSQEKLNALNRNAEVFELIEPVLQIARNGEVKYV